jgi:hypothetical protein
MISDDATEGEAAQTPMCRSADLPLEVISDDVTDPIAAARLLEVFQEEHDAEGKTRHPSLRVMERFLNTRYYIRRRKPLLEWFRKTCDACQELVRGCSLDF